MSAGCQVHDIGLALSPVAYFAQFALDAPCVAMVTASHNENGWTGVKMGAARPLTFGPDEINRLKEIVFKASAKPRPGGSYTRVNDMRETYLKEVTRGHKLSRRIRVVAACGNGTAGAFAPEALERIGADVVPMDTTLDWNFPKYNPNPEDLQMLRAMGEAVKQSGAELALGFDGDGDRCGVVDDHGHEIFADKVGVLLARDLSERIRNAKFVVDVKSTGLYEVDPVLKANGVVTDYWKTGPFLHQAPDDRARRRRRVREERALFLQSAARTRLRRLDRCGDRGARDARPRGRQAHLRADRRAAQDLGLADHGALLSR